MPSDLSIDDLGDNKEMGNIVECLIAAAKVTIRMENDDPDDMTTEQHLRGAVLIALLLRGNAELIESLKTMIPAEAAGIVYEACNWESHDATGN